MATPHTTRLRRVLIDTHFGCVVDGEFDVQRICGIVKRHYPQLCDDSDLCPQNHKNGSNYPEWKHAVRAALKRMKELGDRVSNGKSRGMWSFRSA
jgi:hypothetical protein